MLLYAEYNKINTEKDPALMQIDKLSELRGTGKYNPAPNYAATTDFISEKTYNTSDIKEYRNNVNNGILNNTVKDLYMNSSSSVEIKNSWNKNQNLQNPNLNYDNYQIYALNTIRRTEPIILPYFFASVNVNFIKKKVIDYIFKIKNIKINTDQDTDNLLNLMITKYYDAFDSFATDKITFPEILGNLNKSVIEDYVKNVLSGINMYDYYIKDISNLPTPLDRPTNVNVKGKNELGFLGYFENNNEFSRNLQSYNMKNVVPGPLK